MPARLLQSLSVTERGVSSRINVPWRSKSPGKTDLCNQMSQDGIIVCHSSSTLYYDVIYYIPTSVTSQFFAIGGTKMEWLIHQTNFSHVAKNGLETRLQMTHNHFSLITNITERLYRHCNCVPPHDLCHDVTFLNTSVTWKPVYSDQTFFLHKLLACEIIRPPDYIENNSCTILVHRLQNQHHTPIGLDVATCAVEFITLY